MTVWDRDWEPDQRPDDDVVDDLSVGGEVKLQTVTLEDLALKLDVLGEQMNWLCTNLASLFGFVQQIGASGGGIRGMMKALKEVPPEMTGGK